MGPTRSTRSIRPRPIAPYNAAARPNDAHDNQPQPQQVPAHFLIHGIDVCPRRAAKYKAGQKQPQAAWRIAPRPHQSSSMTLASFMFTLTAYEVREELSRCGLDALKPQHDLRRTSELATLSQLARRCKELDSQRGAVAFHHMLALMNISFFCAR